MIVTKNENIRPVDVDGCLIYNLPNDGEIHHAIDIVDPLDTSKRIRQGVNYNMVRLLKEEYQRGGHIIVWSRSGWEWARNVVLALGIEKYVHEVKSKPLAYFDDTPVKKWMKDRVFIGPHEKYKGR